MNLVPFQFESNQIRVITNESGEPWFVGKDVAIALGYAKPSNAIGQHCRKARYLKDMPASIQGQSNQGFMNSVHSETVLIPESDVYRLVMRSNLETAERFQDWVVEDVLPSIRKTGRYESPEIKQSSQVTQLDAVVVTMSNCKALAEACGLVGNQAILSADKATKKLTGTSPLELLEIPGLVSESQELLLNPSDLGKQFGLSGAKVNSLLASKGFQESFRDAKNRKHWRLTYKGMEYATLFDTNKKHSDGTPVTQIKWRESIAGLIGLCK